MFKFEKTKDPNNEFDTFSTTMVVDNDISWPDLLEQFYSFLLSCGYSISKKKFIEEFGDMVEAEGTANEIVEQKERSKYVIERD